MLQDILNFLLVAWNSLVANLGGEGLALLAVAITVVGLVIAWRLHAAIIQTEFYKKNKDVWDLLDDKIADAIFLVEFGDVDLTAWEAEADKRAQDGLSYIDPRMLYVLDKATAWVKTTFGVTLDFDLVLARAERIFNEVKNDPTNTVGGEPTDPFPVDAPEVDVTV